MMKLILLIVIGIIFPSSLFGSDELHSRWIKAGETWYDRWMNLADEADSMTNEERIALLSRALGVKDNFVLNEKQQEVFDRLQALVLETPGHAQYFADEIERMRQDVEGIPRGRQSDYDSRRSRYLGKILSHLPSPETVKVLGHYLDDMRDEAPPEFDLGENAYLAMLALSRIGLRDSPVQPLRTYRKIIDNGVDLREEPLTRLRAWYKQVESGELAFSFIGQDVEYRFNPDGTWETIPIANPPDDDPREPGALAPEQQVQQPTPENPGTGQDGSGSTLWFWLGGFVAVFSVGIVWFLKRPRNA